MSVDKINTLVVGAGQAGLAMSEHLRAHGLPHLVLERARIAERWRSGRWDSLAANGPAWHDRFPGMAFADVHPDSFATKDEIADYFVDYARMIEAPVRCGVEVRKVHRRPGRPGYTVETSDGTFEALNVVAATGPFQNPVRPAIVPDTAGVTQLHSADYRNPKQLPAGAVLVVGAGSSGVQIADELLRAGRRVFLSVGPHGRPPRTYRGRDFCWWLGVLGKWDLESPGPNMQHVTIAVSGARGGQSIDFRRLAAAGMILLGRTESCHGGTLAFADDLGENIAEGDANYLRLLDEADAYVARNGLDLPLEPKARVIGPDPDCVIHPIRKLDLRQAGITSILWATGYSVDYSWLPGEVLDQKGLPKQTRGVGSEPGIFFLGLPWQTRRGSSFIWGVWHDAKYLADRIATQAKYLAYEATAPSRPADMVA